MTSTKKRAKNNLTVQILIWMAAGFIAGLILNSVGDGGFYHFLVDGVFNVGGRVFLASLKMLVVPLVLVSLVVGTSNLESVHKLGRIGGKTLGLYLTTTAIAISLAMGMALLVKPGAGFSLSTDSTFKAKEAPPFSEVLINIVPSNPVESLSTGNMLQIIFFAVLFGIALTLSGRPGKKIGELFTDLNEVIMRMIMMVMVVAPYGVFCLIGRVFAEQGFAAIVPLAKYFFVVLGVLLLHGLVVYPVLLGTLAGLNPIQFFKKFKEVPIFAFSTASSNATIPITLHAVQEKVGASKTISSFTVPLGATINMDGTAIMQGVATIFISQAYGIDLNFTQLMTVIGTATMASIGTAGVPGVGLIMLAMVLRQVGLPVEGIGLILGVDRLLDMVRTAVNVVGDGTVTAIVAKTEKQLSLAKFRAPA